MVSVISEEAGCGCGLGLGLGRGVVAVSAGVPVNADKMLNNDVAPDWDESWFPFCWLNDSSGSLKNLKKPPR